MYLQLRGARSKRGADWHEGIIPFAHWGDMILSCVDLSDQELRGNPPVVRFEPNMSDEATRAYLYDSPYRGTGLIPESPSLSQWFDDWVNGREMFKRPYKI